MSEATYRCTVQFDAEKKVFRARAPELEHCQAEGQTRAEALQRLEEEMDAQVGNMRERGAQPPPPVDEDTCTGEVQLQLSRSLHRELLFQARDEGVELGQLVSELLAGGVESRRAARGARRAAPPEHEADRGERGNSRSPDRDRPRQGYGGRYHGIMEDRANFIEYVRGLDQGAGQGGGGMGGRRGGRGHRPNKGGPSGPSGPSGPGGPSGPSGPSGPQQP